MADNTKAVYVAVASNAVITVAKFVAGVASGSSSLIAEGFHSIADTADGVLILVGQKQAAKPADKLHPFGRGKELYFWSLIVSVAIIAVGGMASVMEGIEHIVHPGSTLQSPVGNYIALGIAFVAEGTSMVYAWRQFLREKGKGRGIAEGIEKAKDPTTFMVVVEARAAVVGVAVAAAAVFLPHHFDRPQLDGVGAIAVGVIMICVGSFLVYEIRKL